MDSLKGRLVFMLMEYCVPLIILILKTRGCWDDEMLTALLKGFTRDVTSLQM